MNLRQVLLRKASPGKVKSYDALELLLTEVRQEDRDLRPYHTDHSISGVFQALSKTRRVRQPIRLNKRPIHRFRPDPLIHECIRVSERKASKCLVDGLIILKFVNDPGQTLCSILGADHNLRKTG